MCVYGATRVAAVFFKGKIRLLEVYISSMLIGFFLEMALIAMMTVA